MLDTLGNIATTLLILALLALTLLLGRLLLTQAFDQADAERRESVRPGRRRKAAPSQGRRRAR